jgi:hypothetical protein
MTETEKWARKAFAAHPKNWLHKHLHVPIGEHLPRGFLNNIEVTTVGKYAYNPTKIGISKVKVTLPIKRETVAVLNINPPKKHKK